MRRCYNLTISTRTSVNAPQGGASRTIEFPNLRRVERFRKESTRQPNINNSFFKDYVLLVVILYHIMYFVLFSANKPSGLTHLIILIITSQRPFKLPKKKRGYCSGLCRLN